VTPSQAPTDTPTATGTPTRTPNPGKDIVMYVPYVLRWWSSGGMQGSPIPAEGGLPLYLPALLRPLSPF
jgi:hypothetical protein